MMFPLSSSLLVAGIASLVLSSPLMPAKRIDIEPTCTNFTVNVTISAENLVIPLTTPLTYVSVQGTYEIAGRYCEPQVIIPRRANTLQFLVHGIQYTRNYWSGDGAPGYGFEGDTYSWIAYADSQGYPTISIDRLCNGLSAHPDPVVVCQTNAEVETLHQLILLARAGQLPGSTAQVSREFDKVIYVGHSYGSELGNGLTAKYPEDVNAAVLTGFSTYINESLVVLAGASVLPAAIVNPAEYGNLPLNYIEINGTNPFQELFFHPGDYNPALFNLDYSQRGTAAYGEFITVIVNEVASSFTSPVLVMTGQDDSIYCPNITTAAGGCGIGFSTKALGVVSSIYPNANPLTTFGVADAGHCWQLHYNAILNFAVVHDWLTLQGF